MQLAFLFDFFHLQAEKIRNKSETLSFYNESVKKRQEESIMGDEKIRILLVCSAGMSTSLLMEKMQNSARDRGINAEVMAMSSTEADKFLTKEHVDVLLLGPQVRYMKKKYEKTLAKTDIPLAVIDMKDYGKMNGEKVLDAALQLVNAGK